MFQTACSLLTDLSFLKDFSWFDENGLLKRLPDPVRENPTKFEFTNGDEIDPILQTFWGKVK